MSDELETRLLALLPSDGNVGDFFLTEHQLARVVGRDAEIVRELLDLLVASGRAERRPDAAGYRRVSGVRAA
jgi:hypothetical protein